MRRRASDGQAPEQAQDPRPARTVAVEEPGRGRFAQQTLLPVVGELMELIASSSSGHRHGLDVARRDRDRAAAEAVRAPRERREVLLECIAGVALECMRRPSGVGLYQARKKSTNSVADSKRKVNVRSSSSSEAIPSPKSLRR